MRNETVFCKDCGKRLAWWDMFTNIQHDEEWECIGKFRRTLHNTWKSEDGKTILHAREPGPGMVPLKSETSYCSLYYKTRYCKTCARRRHYSCGRPRCKGRIVKVRNRDGSATKHTHGGW